MELTYQRADTDQPNMGITNFPGNKLLKRDVEIAKNYLSEDELNILNRIVTAYLEVAEIQALNRNPMTMQVWIARLNQFLTMTGRELLTHAGKISHESAGLRAGSLLSIFTDCFRLRYIIRQHRPQPAEIRSTAEKLL